MNKERIDGVVANMKEAGLDYLLISEPSSIDYLIDYVNNPGERMYVLMLGAKGDHKLFFNKLFFVDKDLGIDIVWHSDVDDAIQTIVDNLKEVKKIGIDKHWSANFLLDLSEVEVASKLKDIYQKLGATDISFDTIVAYGKNGANPHHENDDSRLNPGDSIIIDMGCKYQGYCSDMTRTVFYKEVSQEAKEVYELVKAANEAAEAIIKPGVKLCDIDKTARDLITKAGYGKEFNHRLGHFIGKDVHEYGDVSVNFDLEVQEGMVFSIEPGVYLAGKFGVRIEDLVLVTKDGCKVLNSYTKDLIVI